MRHSIATCVVMMVLAMSADVVVAQFSGGKGRGQGGPGGPPPEGGEFRPPPSPLMTALDTDNDGQLSAAEIAAAVKSLKTLDKDGDGQLDSDELRPQFGGPGGPGGERGQGGPGGPGAFRPEGRGGPGGPGGPGGLAERIMGFDKDGDGKVARTELPSGMRRIFSRADTDKDGAIDNSEAEALAQMMERRGGNRRPPGRPQ